MTRDELRAGILRLALVVAIAFAIPVLLALLLWALNGGSYEGRLAFSLSIAALLPLLAGVGIFMTTRPVKREKVGEGPPQIRRRDPEEIRERQLLSGGLALLGTAMFAVDLLLR
jgi:hypothetical protein